jgi:small subunit ribosomal protein S17
MNTRTPAGPSAGATAGSPASTPRGRQRQQGTPGAQPQATGAAEQAHEQGRRQQKVGRVTSDKMQKTIVVAVESLKRHPIYKRTYKYTTKFKAHDEQNSARIGDTVRIEETRPLSKEKRWRLVEIIKRAEQTVAPEIVEKQLEQQEGLEPGTGVGGATGR